MSLNTKTKKTQQKQYNNKKDANNLPSTKQAVKTKPKQDKSFSFIFHHFWLFICCSSVILWLDKGDFLVILFQIIF